MWFRRVRSPPGKTPCEQQSAIRKPVTRQPVIRLIMTGSLASSQGRSCGWATSFQEEGAR
eukprot:12049509-Alexandrium_andersonii.AAC.1